MELSLEQGGLSVFSATIPPQPSGHLVRFAVRGELTEVRTAAHELAAEIAASAPLAVASIRETMRGDLAREFRAATDREKAEQDRLRQTDDWKEGVAAMAERRTPDFQGR